jgi:hypothetical protein
MGLVSGNRDPGSGKQPIPDPGSGSRGQKGTGSRIRIRNTEICRIKINYCLPRVTAMAVPRKWVGKSSIPDKKDEWLKTMPTCTL